MKKLQNKDWTSLGAKTSIAILITAAFLMLLISAVQYYYSRRQIRADLERNTEMELVIKAQKIRFSLESMAAYNQDADNMENGNQYYSGGLQPYKTMQTLWYHYDTPKKMFGVSLVGTYMAFRPKYWSLEGEFYYQMGKQEHGLPIDAFMGSVKANVNPSEKYGFSKAVTVSAGYTYMHGTETMVILQQIQEVTEQRNLHWGWLMLSVKPTLFSTIWQDKK